MKIILIALLLFGSASTLGAARDFQPVPSEGQTIEYKDGKAFLIIKGERMHLGVHFVQQSSSTGWLAVIAQNVSDQPFNISETSFAISSSGLALKVYTYSELQKKERNRQAWIAVANGFAAAGNSYSASTAGNNYSYGSYNSRTNATVSGYGTTAYGTANTTGTYSGYSYNAGAAYAAQADANRKNQEIFDRSAKDALASAENLEARALKANTVSPGEVVTGQVMLDLPKKNKKVPVEFVVQISTSTTPILMVFREVL
jgi:hypothetical protein